MLLQVRSNESCCSGYAGLDMDDSGILTTFLHEQLEAHKAPNGAPSSSPRTARDCTASAATTIRTPSPRHRDGHGDRGALAGAAAAHAVNWNLGLGGAGLGGALTVFEGDTLSLLWTSGHDIHRIDGPARRTKRVYGRPFSLDAGHEQHPGGTGSVFDVRARRRSTFCFACTPHFTDMKFSVTVKRRIDAVAFDACTMAHLAVVDALALPKPVSNFLFASEDRPAGWKYVPMSDADVTTADNFFAGIECFHRPLLQGAPDLPLIDLQSTRTPSQPPRSPSSGASPPSSRTRMQTSRWTTSAARQEATSFGVGSASYEADAFNVADDDVYVSLKFLTKFEERWAATR